MRGLVAQYQRDRATYVEFAQRLESLTSELLRDAGLVVHSVSSRAQTIESLKRKIASKGGTYSRLTEVTDLAGVRVITYFAPDVDRVAAIIEREFDIDPVHTVDKRAALDPDRFGYLSLHHVLSLGTTRRSLPEYRRFPDIKAEIQTRSILQHAWAEIEHDLGYKATAEVPRHVRRRFSRVSSLLELADQEFDSIRTALGVYESAVPGEIRRDPSTVTLDRASVDAFIAADSTVRELDQAIAALRTGGYIDSKGHPESLVLQLTKAGLTTVGEVRELLEARRNEVVAFAKLWLEKRASEVGSHDPEPKKFAPGIALFYLAYLLVLDSLDVGRVARYLEEANIGRGKNQQEVATQLLERFHELRSA